MTRHAFAKFADEENDAEYPEGYNCHQKSLEWFRIVIELGQNQRRIFRIKKKFAKKATMKCLYTQLIQIEASKANWTRKA